MDRPRWLWIAALLWTATTACGRASAPASDGPPARVIPLTPSLTEIVVALGAANRIVATDRYSIESDKIAGVPVVSDFLAPNVEAISKLRPDLVILDTVQSKAAAVLADAGIRTMSIDMHSVADVKGALTDVAKALALEDAGQRVIARIDDELAAAAKRAGATPPRVLWVIDRDPAALVGVVAAGPKTYADELLRAVGARNVLTDASVRYPKLSPEALARLEFDVVVDASGGARESMAPWSARLSKDQRASAVAPALAVPGPGVGAAIEALADIVHGEAETP